MTKAAIECRSAAFGQTFWWRTEGTRDERANTILTCKMERRGNLGELTREQFGHYERGPDAARELAGNFFRRRGLWMRETPMPCSGTRLPGSLNGEAGKVV